MASISPADGAVALRSFPRRYGALFATLDDDSAPDDLAHRAGADGHAALDHVAHTARALGLIGEALRQVLVQDEPVLHPAVVDDDAREWTETYAQDPDEVLGLLATEAEQLAVRVESASADDWTRKGAVAGDGTVSALDLLQEAVDTGVEHLRAAERTLAEVRGR
jgi:hypothetical protein